MPLLDTLPCINEILGDGMSFLRKLRYRTKAPFNVTENREKSQVPDFREAPHYHGQLDEALEYMADSLGRSDDFMVRILSVAGREAALLYVDTISDHKTIEETLRTLHQHKFPKRMPKNLAQYLIENVLSSMDALFMTNLYELRECIVSGDVVLLIDKVPQAIVLGAQFVEHRAPEQPFIESASRGSQISLVENLDINVGLIRSALRTETLHVKKMKMGYRSRTDIAILFIEDITNPVAVETVLKRVNAIHTDVIGQSADVEQFIIDNHWTLLPLTRTTQRIDSCVRVLNMGKVIVIVDGDPTALLMPATIIDFFQTEEDYSHTVYESFFIRWLRILAFIFALFLPALYIAFVDFNPELLPKVMGIQIARSREGVPFPAVIEVVMMQLVVEILREATLRMPKQMGQTIGIVGGLVVGEASVQAGLVSNILIIVISLTAISVFVTPSYEFSIVLRLSSWLMIIAATAFGLFGVVLLSILGLYHVASLKSFGITYLDPFTGEHVLDVISDGLFRFPTWAMDRRARHMHPQDDIGDSDYENPIRHPMLESAPHRPEFRKRNRGRHP